MSLFEKNFRSRFNIIIYACHFQSTIVITVSEVTTAYIPRATIAETTTVSAVDAELTTLGLAAATTTTKAPPPTAAPRGTTFPPTERASRSKARDRGENARAKKLPKEDFFNHGLGFRGRRISTEAPSSSASSVVADLTATTPRSETQLRGNPGWTLRRRPGHLDATTIASTSTNRDQTNEIISPGESPRSTDKPLKAGRRGTKRPKAKDESNVAPTSATKSTTRGSKTFNKATEGFGLPRRIEEESDNYPPAFRARLSQLVSPHLC